jgi:hypothetical protein
LRQRSSVERGTPTAAAARSLVRPPARAISQRDTASRRLAASMLAVFAARRRDAARPFLISCAGRPKTCMGFSC